MSLLSTRQSRRLKAISARWQQRALFLLGGVMVGAAAVLLTLLADRAQQAFHQLLLHWHYASLIVTPAGFGLSVYLTGRFFPNSQGSGIPQAIAARQLKDYASRHALVSLRIAVGKMLLTLLGLLCGASAGREGPTVQIGASIMFALGRFSPRRQPGLILAGAAAGVAAAFNTPLAGIVFGIEEMSRAFEVRTSGLIIGGVIAAGLTSMALVGDYTYFGTTSAMLDTATDWLAVPVCGVVGGLMGGIFSRILILVSSGLPGMVGGWIRQQPVLFAMLCGLGVAACGMASGDTTFGTGYEQIKSVLTEGTALPWSFGLLKLAATSLTSISGIPGGIFSPSLAIGGGIGLNLGTIFSSVPVGVMILLGMVAYFAGVVQAPITAFVIVTEMTDNHAMMVPLMATALIASTTSRLICPEGVYHALARNFVRQAQPAERGRQEAPAG